MNHDYHKLKQRKNKIGKNSTVTSLGVFLHRLNILGTKFILQQKTNWLMTNNYNSSELHVLI